LLNHTQESDTVMVFGHAARIYNKSNRNAFFYMPSFNLFKAKMAEEREYAIFLDKITKDYPEVIVLAGHMPAFPFNPKPYLEDMERIRKQSGIAYIVRKVIDNFPIYFADVEKSYISALITGVFLNERLKNEKEKISRLTLAFENNIKQASSEEELIKFVKDLKEVGRFEDLIYAVMEISNGRRFNFSEKDLIFFFLSLGEAQFQTGQIDDAEKTFQEIIKQNPDSFEVYNNLGVIYSAKGQIQEARSMFEKFLSYDPNNSDAKENVILLQNQLDTLSFEKTFSDTSNTINNT